jgi:hypothetical protein
MDTAACDPPRLTLRTSTAAEGTAGLSDTGSPVSMADTPSAVQSAWSACTPTREGVSPQRKFCKSRARNRYRRRRTAVSGQSRTDMIFGIFAFPRKPQRDRNWRIMCTCLRLTSTCAVARDQRARSTRRATALASSLTTCARRSPEVPETTANNERVRTRTRRAHAPRSHPPRQTIHTVSDTRVSTIRVPDLSRRTTVPVDECQLNNR